MILGRVLARDRDLCCVRRIVLGAEVAPVVTAENTHISTARIPVRRCLGRVWGFGLLSLPRSTTLGADFTLLAQPDHPRSASACAAFVW